nr:SseB family protein [uncultured Methanobrevibacter sp.]
MLKESQLFMPIEVTSSIFDNIENAKVGDTIESEEPFRFKTIAINGPAGKAIPLFTSKERMEEAGANVSCIAIFTEDLAGMLKQTGDDYNEVAINPFTTKSLGMPLEGFLNIF